jgi:hypothetical protein
MSIILNTDKEQIEKHLHFGHKLVGHYGLDIGDTYNFNFLNYKVIEICKDNLEGYCWIERIK